MNEQKIVTALDQLERNRIPDDLDLWPRIAGQVRQPTGRHIGWPGRLLRRVTIGIVTLSVLLALGLGTRLLWPARGATPAALQVLSGLAEVAAAQPAYPEEAGYRYVRLEGHYLWMAQAEEQLTSALVAVTRELWVAADGSGRIRQAATPQAFFGTTEQAWREAFGTSANGQAQTQAFGPGGLFYEGYSALPTDRDALFDVIRDRAAVALEAPVGVEMFILIGDLLREPGAPPELRAALFKVASRIDGVELLGDVTDSFGRVGVALAITNNADDARERLVLIFDPSTSALLEDQRVLLEPAAWLDVETPFVLSRTTVLETGLVESLP
ncbi:MAG: CU044_5270 family protein [Anaerolineales bacterium]|nr:CU044_5270 family protein [Anaerolineales bacterium]